MPHGLRMGQSNDNTLSHDATATVLMSINLIVLQLGARRWSFRTASVHKVRLYDHHTPFLMYESQPPPIYEATNLPPKTFHGALVMVEQIVQVGIPEAVHPRIHYGPCATPNGDMVAKGRPQILHLKC